MLHHCGVATERSSHSFGRPSRSKHSAQSRCLLPMALSLILAGACGENPSAVTDQPPSLDPNSRELNLGDSTRLRLVGQSGTTHDSLNVQWSSSDSDVVYVSKTGVAQARGIGSARVNAVTPSATVTAVVRVRPGVLIGAGDIARCPTENGAELTARILDTTRGVVFTAGDNVYETGTPREWAACYEPTWGRHKARTRPATGNHDWYSDSLKTYYEYWGNRAGPPGLGYYSYNVGPWHVVVINVMIAHGKGSPQEEWLRSDLAAHPTRCTFAYWHYPRFSSASEQHSDPGMTAIWQALYDAGADVVVSGHSHTYERFAPQTALGVLDTTRGIREFVVGTGGASLLPFDTVQANSEVRDNSTFGVIKFALYPDRYDWKFIPVSGGTFTDSGSASCH